MSLRALIRRPWCLAALPLLAACSDRASLLPAVPAGPAGSQALQCTVRVAEQRMSCVPATVAGPRADKLLGGQDKYVKLASSGTVYDGGTQVLSSDVTLQNLLKQNIGTTDGIAVQGVDVFLAAQPSVTSGTGSVEMIADGLGTFNGSNQPYYHYAQILSPYEISAARTWQFQITGAVETFTFTAYVSAPMVDEDATLLDKVWTGAVSSDWSVGGNWADGVAPDSASTVSIPADSLLASHTQPVLSASVFLTNLRVGFGSSVSLAGNTLTAYGNVDAVGTISGGTLQSAGAPALLGGSLSATQVTGSAALQRATVTSGAVSVTGTLTVKDQALSISIP